MTAIADAAPRVARPTHQGLSHPDAFAPLYEKVRSELEAIALERPLTDTTSLPPEPKLMEQFGVSRGTLRRAIDELVRDGLLNAEQGRGTYVNQEERIRRVVWNRLANVALPDSRFHLDLRHFVPDFTGRSRADARVVKQSAWTKADTIFLMPDNSTRALRHKALLAGKRILVPTFGFRRGLVVLDGATIPDADKALASTLDGMEQIGERFAPSDMAQLTRVDLVVTGATAAMGDGRVIGRGEPRLAIGWAALEQLGIVDDSVRIIAVLHDCQLVDEWVPAIPEITVDLVATPTRVLRCEPGATPPTGPRAQVDVPPSSVRAFLSGAPHSPSQKDSP